MKILSLALLTIAILSKSLSAQEKNILRPHILDFEFLLGDFDVTVNLPDGNGGWNRAGNGKSVLTTALDGTFIEENKATGIGNTSLTMKNIIGIDPRTKEFRLFALDKEYGTMDIYRGRREDKSIVFDNVSSDARFVSQNGLSYAFRLTYAFVKKNENSLYVESTTDDGKTWTPYAKITYKRVGS